MTACNLDLENCITDTKTSFTTLAITTILKTGAKFSVDRLMKQIPTFVSEIINFLSGMLRDEGGLDYKISIADTIITFIEDNSEAKDNELAHLCEFIEDSEHKHVPFKIPF